MHRIEAEYEVVTPLMLGGANHAPEFRLASFVNVVRWWWRFLALGRYGGDAARATFWEAVLFGWSAPPFGRKRVSFRLLPGKRADEFPPPWQEAKDDFYRKVRRGNREIPAWLDAWSGINYLTAQGFTDRTPYPLRSFAIEARLTEFRRDQGGAEPDPRWKALFKAPDGNRPEEGRQREFLSALGRSADQDWEEAKKTFVDALALVGLIGGLGARSRRGFGSLAIKQLRFPATLIGNTRRPFDQAPAEIGQYCRRVLAHLGRTPHRGLPPYTAFSDRTLIAAVANAGDAATLMNDVGFALQFYRTWGERSGGAHRHRYVANSTQQWIGAVVAKTGYRFTDDHIWYLNLKAHVDSARRDIQAIRDDTTINDKEKKHRREGQARGRMEDDISSNVFSAGVPRRIAFGLPHNYFIRPSVPLDGEGRQLNATVSIEPAASGRRASPLMLHFHPLASGQFVAVVCCAPAVFLPGSAEVEAGVGKRRSINQPLAGQSHLSDFRDVAGFIDAVSSGAWKSHLKDISTICSRTDIFPTTIP